MSTSLQFCSWLEVVGRVRHYKDRRFVIVVGVLSTIRICRYVEGGW